MRSVCLGVVLMTSLVAPNWASGAGAPLPDLPPLLLTPATDLAAIPAGRAVSRPLSACADPPPEPEPTPAIETLAGPARGLGGAWVGVEYLVWWPKGQALPPLLTAGPESRPAIPGRPGADVLFGGSQLSPTAFGGRFTLGVPLDPAETTAVAVTYFFLGPRTESGAFRSGRSRALGRPYVDADSGEPGILGVAGPGESGAARAALNVRAAGWEVNSLWALGTRENLRVHALAGYRYFQLSEGVRVEQLARDGAGVASGAVDQFDARNRFHGAQLGLGADCSRGALLLEFAGKVALGQTAGVRGATGATAVRLVGGGFAAAPGGVYAGAGASSVTSFGVLPEAAVRVGYRLRDRSCLYLGYNFLFLSDVVRPGDAIDPALDPTQPGAERTLGQVGRTGFWVQGITLGLELRY